MRIQGFGISRILDLFDFEFVSDFEIRISDFDSQLSGVLAQ